MFFPDILEVSQPIVTQTEAVATEGGTDAAATVMSTDDDVADLEDIDGELHHRQAIEIGVHDQIGYIAMNKQFTGQESDDFVGGDPAIGTANPEVFRGLLAGELEKEFRVDPSNLGGPSPVIGE